jgi:hypothetical protein
METDTFTPQGKYYTLGDWKLDILLNMFYAHTTPNPDKSDWQLLQDHLNGVAKISSEFADDNLRVKN